MLSQLQGRLSRRCIAIFAVFSALFLLWHWFRDSGCIVMMDNVRYKPSSYDWGTARVFHPLKEPIKSPPSGKPKAFPAVQAQGILSHGHALDAITEARKHTVKSKFVKSWNAYKTYAWTKDELMPLSGKGKQSFGGWSAQLVDTLDTLWIMDLKDDFHRAVKHVAVIDWAKTGSKPVDLFEVTIRYLGGLLGAFELSGAPVLLGKAVELGDAIYAAFDTPNRLPTRWMDYRKAKAGEQIAEKIMSSAAGGTLGLELTRLSQLTGDPKYYDATERVKQFFYRTQNDTLIPGLWPMLVNFRNETAQETMFTLGAGADSLYEYLPKMHLLLGGMDSEYEEMALQALDAAKEHILFRPVLPQDKNILLAGNAVSDEDVGHKLPIGSGRTRLLPEMQHLACFAGAMYGLAGKIFSRGDYVDLASRLTAGCVWAYDSFPTNIMPEISHLLPCENLDGPCSSKVKRDALRSLLPEGFIRVRDPRYLLRPEAIESVFYMWRITGDSVWREAAWRMWEGIVKETETEIAFAAVGDVTVQAGTKIDSMETFWLSETLKYFYLIFNDNDVLSLDEWVLNTEAHPFKRAS